MLSILVAVGVGVVLAIVTAFLVYRVDVRVNVTQRQLNKVENRLAAAGSFWLSELFADLIVGDVKSAELKIRQFVEADDTTLFFLDNVAFPLALYTIKETKAYYPDKYAQLVKEVTGTVKNGNGAVVQPAEAPSA